MATVIGLTFKEKPKKEAEVKAADKAAEKSKASETEKPGK